MFRCLRKKRCKMVLEIELARPMIVAPTLPYCNMSRDFRAALEVNR
jgi:hypothetical protein